MARTPQASPAGQQAPPPPPPQPATRGNGFTLAGITPLATWPIPGDAASLLGIVEDQATTITAQEALLHAYQLDLNTAQAQAGTLTATGIGTASGATLTMTSVTGTIVVGAEISGAGVPAGTVVLNQQSGTTGGAGVYTTDQPTTASAAPLAFTPPPAQVATGTGTGTATSLAVTAVTGTIAIQSKVAGAGVPANTIILGQVSGTAGAAGTYTTSQPTTANASPLAFTAPPPPPATPWPIPQDAVTLNTISQQQTAILRTQNALLQHYQDLLTTSGTTPPGTGP
jgi:hypothetical protein